MIKYVMMLLLLSIVVISGCTSDTNKVYIGKTPEQCQIIKFYCEQGQKPFFDDKGCGCEPDSSTSTDEKLKAIDCTDPRPQACTKEYMPVCGQVQVQCIKAPCTPVMQTFGNKCMACSNPLTISYMQGACKNNIVVTVPSETPEEQCKNVGGTWTGYDCTEISVEQCQEIGGEFEECASACRNDPSAEVCTMQCVQVCRVKA